MKVFLINYRYDLVYEKKEIGDDMRYNIQINVPAPHWDQNVCRVGLRNIDNS